MNSKRRRFEMIATPNLKAPRSRSSSSERPEDGSTNKNLNTKSTDEFKTPRKFIRKRTLSIQPIDSEAASTTPFKLKSRPPPIHVYTKNMKTLTKIITDGKIPEGDFWVRYTDKDYITVKSLNIETYKLIKEILKVNEVQFYPYTPKEDKKISLVLKGIKSEYDESDVINSINSKNLTNVKIERVTKLQFDLKVADKFYFIVQLSNGSKPAELTRIKRMLHQNIRWERLKKKAATVNPNFSYANVMDNNSAFPPLPRRFNVNESPEDTLRPPPNNNSAQHTGNNFTSIEKTLNQFKNSMLNIIKEQFTEMNKKITDNSRKIEFLLSTFDNE
ncbi:hypothetical protein KQX54_007181 [Cotesia glomerata]|uniref:Uncharacterized protein n=1 Tax=Cotesia glomerata TaxID=32391 RepID=A0AAV7IKA8_COTGL|nr:hypothetical protein KQX54_007181 [Cotesia glomerata]